MVPLGHLRTYSPIYPQKGRDIPHGKLSMFSIDHHENKWHLRGAHRRSRDQTERVSTVQ